MKRLLSVVSCVLFLFNPLFSQEWEQTGSIPEGSGVTGMVYREQSNSLFVTTSSNNWPSGDMGGIRRSSDEGETWTNLVDSYNARNIILGPDDQLYVSNWPYPQPEGLYRSADNGDTWQLLTTVATGNNIFSFAVDAYDNSIPKKIYAGTRTGVLRSLDNGISWGYATNGMAADSWVYDLAIDSSGVVAAATSNGLYISHDHGDSWQIPAGIPAGPVVSVLFNYPLIGKDDWQLIIGNANGDILVANKLELYLTYLIMYSFILHSEVSQIAAYLLSTHNKRLHGVITYPTQPSAQGGFSVSEDSLKNLQLMNPGLPSNPKTSAQSAFYLPFKAEPQLRIFVGLFEGMDQGARIFKTTYTFLVGIEENFNRSGKLEVTVNPNPAISGNLQFTFYTNEVSEAEIRIYDSYGHMISTMKNIAVSPGRNEKVWDYGELASGLYFYTVTQGSVSRSGKVILN